jgi:hypothetical protein
LINLYDYDIIIQMYFQGLAFIFVVLLILLFSTCVGCYSFAPYDNNVFSIQYPYEAFREGVDEEEDDENEEKEGMEEGMDEEDEEEEDQFTTMKSGINNIVSKITGSPEEKKKEDEPKKVEGFGLMPAPYGIETPIDRFSSLKSDKSCTPSPYSTSTGFLCMDKDTERLLRTRGGNITSGDSQIGSA